MDFFKKFLQNKINYWMNELSNPQLDKQNREWFQEESKFNGLIEGAILSNIKIKPTSKRPPKPIGCGYETLPSKMSIKTPPGDE